MGPRYNLIPILMSTGCFLPVPTCSLGIQACSNPQNQKTTRRRVRRVEAPPNARPVSSLTMGENLIGTIDRVGGADSAWININCATLTGKLIHARLRLQKDRRSAPRNLPEEGGTLAVRVARLNIPAARVEVVPAWELPPAPAPPAVHRLEDLQVGQRLPGVVVGLVTAGAVIDVRASRPGRRGARKQCTGLLRRAHFADGWASAKDPVIPDTATRVLQVGDAVDVFVRAAVVQSAGLFLDASPITADQVREERRQWLLANDRRRRRKGVSTLSVGERRTGTVRNVQKYGCFVDVGVKTDGLIHFSRMGEKHSGTWKTTVPEGARVIVEVSAIDGERISLRLIRLEDDDLEEFNDVENLATARSPEPKKIEEPADDEQADEERADKDTDDEDDDSGSVSGKWEDKFTDEYLEDKYDF